MDNSGQAIMQVFPNTFKKWPALFDSLGCLTAFTHHARVDLEVAPVIQPLRQLPFTFHNGVAAELSSMLEEGIIKLIDVSPWVLNLVVAKKKMGDLTTFMTHAGVFRYMCMLSGLSSQLFSKNHVYDPGWDPRDSSVPGRHCGSQAGPGHP